MTDPKLHHPYHRNSTCLLPHQGSHPVLAVTHPTGANLTFLLGYCPLPAPPVLSLTQEDFKVASSEQQGTLGQLGRVLPFFFCALEQPVMVAVPKFTSDAEILLNTSPGTKVWGRGGRSGRKPALSGLQGPIWVTANYCSTLSRTLGSTLIPQCSGMPYPRLAPSQFPPATQCPHIRKPRGGALQKLEGRALGFHHCHDPHGRGRKFSG